MAHKARIAVIGAGSWAVANHIPILARHHEVELAAVSRLGTAELRQVQDLFGFPIATEDYRQLLAAGPFDGAVIASPHHLHAEHAVAAIEAGAHVMVEKPLATSIAEGRRIIDAARAYSRQILVPYGWNFEPWFIAARRLVIEGRIGAIRHVVAQMATPIEALVSGSPHPLAVSELFKPAPETWARKGSGGYGWGQLVHLLGAVFYLTRLSPETVFARLGKSAIGTDIHDALTVSFAGGATGAISGSATVPPGAKFQLDIRVFGTEGQLLLDIERERVELTRNDGVTESVPVAPGAGVYTCVRPVNAFVDICLDRPVENAGDGDVGQSAVEVVDAMLRSDATESVVRIR